MVARGAFIFTAILVVVESQLTPAVTSTTSLTLRLSEASPIYRHVRSYDRYGKAYLDRNIEGASICSRCLEDRNFRSYPETFRDTAALYERSNTNGRYAQDLLSGEGRRDVQYRPAYDDRYSSKDKLNTDNDNDRDLRQSGGLKNKTESYDQDDRKQLQRRPTLDDRYGNDKRGSFDRDYDYYNDGYIKPDIRTQYQRYDPYSMYPIRDEPYGYRDRDPYNDRNSRRPYRRPSYDRYDDDPSRYNYGGRYDDYYGTDYRAGGKYYDGYYGVRSDAYDRRRPAFEDRFGSYADRGNGYDDRGYSYTNRQQFNSFRPWDETYRGSAGFDDGGRGYYFASGRPDLGATGTWGGAGAGGSGGAGAGGWGAARPTATSGYDAGGYGERPSGWSGYEGVRPSQTGAGGGGYAAGWHNVDDRIGGSNRNWGDRNAGGGGAGGGYRGGAGGDYRRGAGGPTSPATSYLHERPAAHDVDTQRPPTDGDQTNAKLEDSSLTHDDSKTNYQTTTK